MDKNKTSNTQSGVLHSETLNADRTYSVFLPNNYDADSMRRYPILYMLHGLSGTDQGWFENYHFKDIYDSLVDAGEIEEMIVVMANAGGDILKDWNGYFDVKGWQYETFYFTEFMPFIEKNYRVIADKQHCAIVGISMGGGGATSYAQRHSELFGSVYAMSALMDLSDKKYMPDNMSAMLGDANQHLNNEKKDISKIVKMYDSVKKHSCIKYIEFADNNQKEQLRSINWFIDCGKDDFLFDRNNEFVQAMEKSQIPCLFYFGDGGHVHEYWESSLPNCLKFVSKNY